MTTPVIGGIAAIVSFSEGQGRERVSGVRSLAGGPCFDTIYWRQSLDLNKSVLEADLIAERARMSAVGGHGAA